MKKIIFPAFAAITLILAGCFDNTSEVTLKEDGAGTVSNTYNMGTLVAMAKQMGGAGELGKMDEAITDTSFSLASKADSIPNLSPAEKEMLKTGTTRLQTDIKKDKFIVTFSFPMASASEIPIYNKLSGKILNETLIKLLQGVPMDAMQDLPEPSSFDDYFITTYGKDDIKRTINKDKYASAQSDEYLKGLQEAASMGVEVVSALVINLPRPATKVEGPNAVLSDDKKKLTVKGSVEDFFEHPEKWEFKVKF